MDGPGFSERALFAFGTAANRLQRQKGARCISSTRRRLNVLDLSMGCPTMHFPKIKARANTAAILLLTTLAGCAAQMGSGCGKPGDYATNVESVPLSLLYPGHYPQTAESTIGSGVAERYDCR